MRTKRLFFGSTAVVLLALLFLLPGPSQAGECTTAVVSGSATTDGRPLLWKNRDTDDVQNKLTFLSEGPLAATAMVTSGSSASVWMGVNEAGFAIENSVSADLEGTSSSENGSFMKRALLNCATVAAFEALLLETNATGRGTQANYGVIDATGAAAIFEVGNHTFRKYDAADPSDAPNGFIVRTNFAFTGDGSGAGQVRYDRAVELLTGAALAGTLDYGFLLRTAARDLKNDVIDPYPLPYEGSQDGLPPGYIKTTYSISRSTTRSAAVFHGVLPGEDPRLTTMWAILGEPVCAVALPVWPLAGSVPAELGGPAAAPLCVAALVKKGICYPLAASPGYINTYMLDDGQGGGVFSCTDPIEDWTMARAEALLVDWRTSLPTSQAVSAAQDDIARRAYWCFLASSVPNDSLSEPLNLNCGTLENRSLLLREYIHRLTWQAPTTGTAASYRIYDVSAGRRDLVAEVPAGTMAYLRRHVSLPGEHIYAVLAVDGTGAEGSPACLETIMVPGDLDRISGKSARMLKTASELATLLRRSIRFGWR